MSSRSPKPFSALFVAMLTVTLTLVGLAASSFAATPRAYAVDSRTGTLTISAIWNRDTDKPVPLAGDTYSIVRVASADLDKNGKPTAFHTLKAFAAFDREWRSLSASEYNTAAKELAEYASKHDLYEHSGKTNAAGQLKFANLPTGLYLAARTAVASANKAYTCDPFLVAVPGVADDGTGEFNVTSEPKFSGDDTPDPNPNPNPDNPDNPNPDNPGNPDNPNPDNPDNPEPNPTPTPNPGTTPGGTEIPADTGAAISAVAFVAIACTVAAVIIHDLRRDRSKNAGQESSIPTSPAE
ncbi:cell surface protein [Bifidobacterium miconisargentati]|uniref:cell surface protein n=1 Tax=Bifidobacterium miconisargentati TaxID=2834437 RepID=UPI001BDD6A73|nr:cell surface protein [Bifidobacterium miconisargentati]MBW3089552.1 cell surface protein [Bifidobacterium miconisargentati]